MHSPVYIGQRKGIEACDCKYTHSQGMVRVYQESVVIRNFRNQLAVSRLEIQEKQVSEINSQLAVSGLENPGVGSERMCEE
jgi:hypothetical protein